MMQEFDRIPASCKPFNHYGHDKLATAQCIALTELAINSDLHPIGGFERNR